MKRPMARKRQLDGLKQKKKEVVVRDLWHGAEELLNDPRFVGKLLKGKIHCSCSICTTKTKKDGWKHSDMQKLESISNQLLEEYDKAYEELAEMELKIGLWEY